MRNTELSMARELLEDLSSFNMTPNRRLALFKQLGQAMASTDDVEGAIASLLAEMSSEASSTLAKHLGDAWRRSLSAPSPGPLTPTELSIVCTVQAHRVAHVDTDSKPGLALPRTALKCNGPGVIASHARMFEGANISLFKAQTLRHRDEVLSAIDALSALGHDLSPRDDHWATVVRTFALPVFEAVIDRFALELGPPTSPDQPDFGQSLLEACAAPPLAQAFPFHIKLFLARRPIDTFQPGTLASLVSEAALTNRASTVQALLASSSCAIEDIDAALKVAENEELRQWLQALRAATSARNALARPARDFRDLPPL